MSKRLFPVSADHRSDWPPSYGYAKLTRTFFYFSVPYFCTMCGLRNLELLIKTGWNVFVRFVAENAGRG